MSQQLFDNDQEVTIDNTPFIVTGVQYDENPETQERTNYTYHIKTREDVEALAAKAKEQE